VLLSSEQVQHTLAGLSRRRAEIRDGMGTLSQETRKPLLNG
jgi:hypothetical protein